MRFDVLTGPSMIVSNEPIALVVSRVSREMMPCSYPVPTLCPCPAYSRRSDRYEGGAMTGEEKERGTTSNAPPFRGVGSVACQNKTPAWETSSPAGG